MATTTYAQLNLGRNIGTESMTDSEWASFVLSARINLALATGAGVEDSVDMAYDDVQVHYGTGEWAGVTEESAHVSLYSDKGIDLDKLTGTTRALAQRMGQDAIALVTGSVLITPEAPAAEALPAPVSARRHVAVVSELTPA